MLILYLVNSAEFLYQLLAAYPSSGVSVPPQG